MGSSTRPKRVNMDHWLLCPENYRTVVAMIITTYLDMVVESTS